MLYKGKKWRNGFISEEQSDSNNTLEEIPIRFITKIDRTYVTDPKIWEAFYKNMSENKFNPYKFRQHKKFQTGRGRYGRFKGSYIIPVNQNIVNTDPEKTKTTLVTPIEAAAKRDASELKYDRGENKPHVK